MKSKHYKENIAPALVLVLICLVVTVALSQTFAISNPIIEENASITADETRARVLEEADSFSMYEGELGEGILECYFADNASGMVVTAGSKSFGGLLLAMVGIDKEGKVVGIEIMDHADTPGLGTKPMAVDYLKDRYFGKTSLDAEHIKSDPEIDQVTGATISSNAIYQAIKAALVQFQKCGGELK